MIRKHLTGKKVYFFYALYFSDVLMYIISSQLMLLLLVPEFTLPVNHIYIQFMLFTMLVLFVSYSYYGLYRDKRNLFDDDDIMNILYSELITFFVLFVWILIFTPGDLLMYMLLLLVLLLNFFLVIVGRSLLYRLIKAFRLQGYDQKKVLIFGKLSGELRDKIEDNRELGYRVVKMTNSFQEMKANLKKVDIVFLTKEIVDDKLMGLMIENEHVNWKIVPSVLNLVIEPVAFDEFKDYPIINVSPTDKNRSYLPIKRVMDIFMSGAALIILAVPFLIVAALIKIMMPGPVFFMQERLGQDLKPFKVFKFRSMIVDADSQKKNLQKKNEVKGLFKIKDDPRITPLGRFLRRSCIDELPQLINVLVGDMSIVGPRPHLQIELEHFRGWRRARFRVKPGITGMWQVSGRHEINFDKAVLYDIYYIKHMSPRLDLQIILKTIPAILMSRGRH